MAYLTQINGATVDLEAATPIVTLPSTGVLNSFGESVEFTSYNVDGTGDGTTAETVETGDFLAPVVDGTPVPGTYGGGVELSNAGLNLLGISITVNPVEGNYFYGDDGSVYIITDAPLDANNLTASASALGLDLANVSLTALLDNALVSGVVPGGTVNGLLNAVVTTQDGDPTVDLVISPAEINDIVCFVAGTMILTPTGYRRIEELNAGDLVCTKDNGAKPIQWIGSRRLLAATLQMNPKLYPIRISAGALGDNIPSKDLLVSPQHRVLVRSKIAIRMFGADEVLVAAKQLLCLDGIDIADDQADVHYYHFLFDQHEVVMSNGAETESLYTGVQALKGVGQEAREEIFAIFPELQQSEYEPMAARRLVSGRQGRKLAMRHLAAERPLVL